MTRLAVVQWPAKQTPLRSYPIFHQFYLIQPDIRVSGLIRELTQQVQHLKLVTQNVISLTRKYKSIN